MPQDEFEKIIENTFERLNKGFRDLREKQGNEGIIKSIDSFFSREIIVEVLIEDELQQFHIHEDTAH